MIRIFALIAMFVISGNASADVTLAFGSCNDVFKKQPYWKYVEALNPDAWIWGGDVVYADFSILPMYRRELFMIEKHLTGYENFKKGRVILGTWDDHDYAYDNAGAGYLLKKSSQRIFLDFLGVESTDKRWERDGIYHSQILGAGEETVKIVVPDLRFFRKSVKDVTKSSLLGDVQWTWLENEVLNNDAKALVLVSSSQVIPHEKGNGDTWSYFPKDKERLLELLSRSPKPFIILSGDRHYAEYSKMSVSGREFFEFTSSGLTHFKKAGWDNPYRVGKAYSGKNFGVVRVKFSRDGGVRIVTELYSAENGKLVDTFTVDRTFKIIENNN